MTEKNEVLVVVHPGSACGSANSNIGKFEARAARDALVYALDHWTGGVIVIDGALSDELPGYPLFATAIEACLQRATASGQFAHRMMADDGDQAPKIIELVREHAQALQSATFAVSGTWYHPEDGSGCVGSVIDALRSLGCRAEVDDSAVHLCEEEDDVDDEAIETIR